MCNREARVPYDFTLTALIPASAREIYEAWLDSLAHSEMTGGEARMSDEIGGEVSAWAGYITGRNPELVPHERIVQSWRTTEFTDDHGDSIVTVTLEDDDEGTLLTLVHSNVPDGQTKYEQRGWQEHYFEPMAEFFSKRAGTGKRAGAAPKPKRTVSKVTTKAVKEKSKRTAPKATRKAVRKKSKRTASKVTKKAVKKNSKRTAPKPTRKAVRKSSKRPAAKSKKKVR
jgi:uncharacterized protein YndB with AHSA1/START domain